LPRYQLELNERQKKFCQEYLVDFNATQAAIRAGYSKNTAKGQGSDLLTRPHVKAEIKRLQGLQAERLEITADKILQEYANIAFAHLTDVVTINGNNVTITNTDEWPEQLKCAVESIAQTKDGIRIKLHSKAAALDKLAEYVSLFRRDDVLGPLKALADIGVLPPQVAEVAVGEMARVKDAIAAALEDSRGDKDAPTA
jgi:phage terminase small subunit